jgi:hypothetical protein
MRAAADRARSVRPPTARGGPPATVFVPALPSPLDPPSTLLMRRPSVGTKPNPSSYKISCELTLILKAPRSNAHRSGMPPTFERRQVVGRLCESVLVAVRDSGRLTNTILAAEVHRGVFVDHVVVGRRSTGATKRPTGRFEAPHLSRSRRPHLLEPRSTYLNRRALAHELHAVGAAGVHQRLQERRVLGRRLGVELVQRSTIRVSKTRPSLELRRRPSIASRRNSVNSSRNSTPWCDRVR